VTHPGVALAIIVGLGIGAQWIAWRLRLPSILLLLIFGFVAGPVSRAVDPEGLFGDLLFPIVSISVAIILFEGGLTLKLSELQEIGKVVRNLILLGCLVTWALVTAGALVILDFGLELAVLFGAILVVTGPTVVLPLLRHVQPSGQLRSILKWEGILNDPVGAILAVLVFEAMFVAPGGSFTLHALVAIGTTLLSGGLFGIAGALLLWLPMRRYWIPDFLQSAVSLMVVVVAFTASNELVEESGLVTVTVMGIALANKKSVPVKHIAEFKENLSVLLIASLFIILSARLDFDALGELDWRGIAFLAFLILLVRPLVVFISTRGAKLTVRERIFLAWMAPRGVVAAAVASVFAMRLTELDYQGGAERLVPVTFLVIIGTITVYGLTAYPLARWIGVSKPRPQGVLFVGAHRWARAIASVLRDHGVAVLLADTNRANIRAAKMDGLRTHFGSALSDYALEEMDLDGIGRLAALTNNDEANSLAVLHFTEMFGRAEVYQLANEADRSKEDAPVHLRGRPLFAEGVGFAHLADRFFAGAVVKATRLTEDFDFDSVRKLYGEAFVPLFSISEKGEVRVFTAGGSMKPEAGTRLVCVVDEASTGDLDPGGTGTSAGAPPS